MEGQRALGAMVAHSCGHIAYWYREDAPAEPLPGPFVRGMFYVPCPWCGGEAGTPRLEGTAVGFRGVPGVKGAVIATRPENVEPVR